MEDSTNTEDEIMLMRRELVYECSIFLLTCHRCKKSQKPYRDELHKSEKSVERMYKAVLNYTYWETWFCSFLLNQVDLGRQKAQLGAAEIRHFKYLIAEFWMFWSENTTTLPKGRFKGSDNFNKRMLFNRHFSLFRVNVKYYDKVKDAKFRNFCKGYKKENFEIRKGFDVWNQAMRDLITKQYILNSDPEMLPLFIVQRRLGGVETFFCGSVRENVVTTLMVHPKYGGTDIDEMTCTYTEATLHDLSNRPGYTMLHVDDGVTCLDTDDNNFILSSCYKLRSLMAEETDPSDIRKINRFSSISGPAISLFWDPSHMLKLSDLVPGLYRRDRVWPPVAKEWQCRDLSELSGWPTQALIDQAVSYGTYVVPVAHKNSDNPDIEWRYSFSRAEVDLMLSITKKQRKCYMLTKRLCQLIFSGFDAFRSYFIKTSFFWMLEETPAVYWERMNMDDMVDYLLDKIIFFFADSYLPNYFIRQSNIVDHLSRDHVATIRRKLKQLRLRRDTALPQHMLKDVCLYLINMTVGPVDNFHILSLPQHWMVYIVSCSEEPACTKSTNISEILHKYSQQFVCGQHSDAESSSHSKSSSSPKVPLLIDKLRGLDINKMLEISAEFPREEIQHQVSTLRVELARGYLSLGRLHVNREIEYTCIPGILEFYQE